MGLFDKKYCDICGEKIGLLGNRKLEDGNLCKTAPRSCLRSSANAAARRSRISSVSSLTARKTRSSSEILTPT